MNSKVKVLCFGEVLWDNLPTGPVPGGAPMNVAYHLNKFGIEASTASSIGNDEKGKTLAGFIENCGMETSLIQIHPTLPTSEVKVWLDEKNNASFEICEPVAWDEILLTNELKEAAETCSAIVFGSLASRNVTTRTTLLSLLENKLLKIMDVNLRAPFNHKEVIEPLLNRSDIVKLNDSELIQIGEWYGFTGELKEVALMLTDHFSLDAMLITRGENGACIVTDGSYYEHPGYKVQVADTVGSGDAFLAGFLSAWFNEKPIPEALNDACVIGAVVATYSGATPDYKIEDLNVLIN